VVIIGAKLKGPDNVGDDEDEPALKFSEGFESLEELDLDTTDSAESAGEDSMTAAEKGSADRGSRRRCDRGGATKIRSRFAKPSALIP
jgi:hypothetical protein